MGSHSPKDSHTFAMGQYGRKEDGPRAHSPRFSGAAVLHLRQAHWNPPEAGLHGLQLLLQEVRGQLLDSEPRR